MHVAMLSHDIDGASNDKFSADAQTCCAEQMADCSVYCRLTECKLLYLIGVCMYSWQIYTPRRCIQNSYVFYQRLQALKLFSLKSASIQTFAIFLSSNF